MPDAGHGLYGIRPLPDAPHEELFTGYGKPQLIYTLFFFPNHLSPQTLHALRQRYQLSPTITMEMVGII